MASKCKLQDERYREAIKLSLSAAAAAVKNLNLTVGKVIFCIRPEVGQKLSSSWPEFAMERRET